MKINVNKTGSNDRGVWIHGTADLGGLEITSLFSTNLKEPPKVGEDLTFKKIRIVNGKKGMYYQLTF